jgi:hypothetical protein
MYGGFCDNVHTPRPEGYSNGDHALPHRYPLSTCTRNIIKCKPGSARRLALETMVLDGRAIGGLRARPLTSFLDMNPGTGQEKIWGNARENFRERRQER